MSVTYVITMTRPNSGVQWHFEADSSGSLATLSYMQTNYIDNGKIISYNRSINGNDVTYTTVFMSEAEHVEYQNDATLTAWKQYRVNYNTTNGITSSDEPDTPT